MIKVDYEKYKIETYELECAKYVSMLYTVPKVEKTFEGEPLSGTPNYNLTDIAREYVKNPFVCKEKYLNKVIFCKSKIIKIGEFNENTPYILLSNEEFVKASYSCFYGESSKDSSAVCLLTYDKEEEQSIIKKLRTDVKISLVGVIKSLDYDNIYGIADVILLTDCTIIGIDQHCIKSSIEEAEAVMLECAQKENSLNVTCPRCQTICAKNVNFCSVCGARVENKYIEFIKEELQDTLPYISVGDDWWVGEDIPKRYINTAIENFATDANANEVLGLCSTSIMIKGKRGYLFTANAVYVKTFLDKPIKIRYDQMQM